MMDDMLTILPYSCCHHHFRSLAAAENAGLEVSIDIAVDALIGDIFKAGHGLIVAAGNVHEYVEALMVFLYVFKHCHNLGFFAQVCNGHIGCAAGSCNLLHPLSAGFPVDIARMTTAPSPAKRCAVAKPIHPAAPVTSAVLPLSLMKHLLLMNIV